MDVWTVLYQHTRHCIFNVLYLELKDKPRVWFPSIHKSLVMCIFNVLYLEFKDKPRAWFPSIFFFFLVFRIQRQTLGVVSEYSQITSDVYF